jgi:ribosomal protein S18 acetylase RimI-like enzyme
MSEVVVGEATSSDIPELVALMDAFYAEFSYPLDRHWASNSFAQLLSTPALGSVWLARAGGRPVGHAVLSVRYTMEHGALSGYIDDLYVSPLFRQRHIASQLLRALGKECGRRGCAAVYVEVGDTNTAALATYRKFGLMPTTDGRLLLSGGLGATNT